MRGSPPFRRTIMKLPDKKGGPRLPPPPKGGGAAARQRQFEMERGLVKEPLPEEPEGTAREDDSPCDKGRKNPKSKS
jgi:hypothetical protein